MQYFSSNNVRMYLQVEVNSIFNKFLSQQVGWALSSADQPLSVSSYYTVAMGLQHEAYSPVFMGRTFLFQVLFLLVFIAYFLLPYTQPTKTT